MVFGLMINDSRRFGKFSGLRWSGEIKGFFEERIGEDFTIGEAIFGLDDEGNFRVFLIGGLSNLLWYGLE